MRKEILEFTLEDVEFTRTWWSKLCKDRLLVNNWLKKLQVTETEGFYDNFEAIPEYAPQDSALRKLLIQTGLDELKHGDLLADVMRSRGLDVPKVREKSSSFFWGQMDSVITSPETMCAVFYLGEALAAFRFETMHGCPSTPSDIKAFLDVAIPEEQYHARGFLLHTTAEDLSMAKVRYHEVVSLMKGRS